MNDIDSAHVRDVIVSNVSSISAQIEMAIERLGSFAVAYRLIPFRDGTQWCVLLGDDLQSGIAGFGDSPALAVADFDRAMYTKFANAKTAVKDSLTTAPAATTQEAGRDAVSELVNAAKMAVEMIETEKHERRHVRWALKDSVVKVESMLAASRKGE